MKRAKAYGIDAFALNIGVDGYTDTQLGYAYESANNNGMKVFISFDFNWYSPSSGAATVGAKIAQYASKPAQLIVDNKVFASSFAGDELDVATMRSAAGVDVFFAPNFHPEQGTATTDIDGALNWMVPPPRLVHC
jgi:Glycosyl hydrolase family 71